MQLVKAYGAEQRETERLSEIAGRLRDARIDAVRLRGTFEALLDVVPSLTNVGLVLLGAFRVQQRRPHRRRAVQLRLPVHAARVPAAADRLRALRAAALARRLAAGPRGARRADRARPAGVDRPPPSRASGVQLDDRRLHVPGREPRRRSTTCRSTSPRAASSPSSARPARARPRWSSSSAGWSRRPPATSPPGRASGRSCSRRRSCSPARSATTSRSATPIDDDEIWEALRLARADDFVAETAARPRHGRRRARRQPQRRAAPARRPRQGARPPAGAAAARRHDVGARPGHRGRRPGQPARAPSPAPRC